MIGVVGDGVADNIKPFVGFRIGCAGGGIAVPARSQADDAQGRHCHCDTFVDFHISPYVLVSLHPPLADKQ